MDLANKLLQSTFGLKSFKGVQEKAIRTLLVAKQSALVVTATGGGKSLVYQLSSLVLPGLTIVISPLLSLMKDQVDALKALGILAAEMNSSCTSKELEEVRAALSNHNLKLLYIAPERLNTESFITQMEDYQTGGSKISLIAIDEVHCVSNWGFSFRPQYLKVARFVKEIRAERVVCLTATATDETIAGDIPLNSDITKEFDIEPINGVFKHGIFRSNLSLQINPCQTMEEKLEQLVPFPKSRKSGSAIVYATSREDCESAAVDLEKEGII